MCTCNAFIADHLHIGETLGRVDSGDPRLFFCNTLPFLTRLNYAQTDGLVRNCP